MSQDKFTRAARGQNCLIRLPGCLGTIETVVPCHYRLAGYCGTGLKPPNWMIAFGCAHCHSVCDGREFIHDHSRDKVRLAHAEGVLRTIHYLIDVGLLRL